jgi:hypothetical protein
MRKPEVAHVAGEIVFAEIAAEAQVEAPLLADARHRQSAVVVRRIQQARGRQREQPAVHRAIQRTRVALLKSVRPVPRISRQSPVKAIDSSSSTRLMQPLVWPGVARTVR